MVDYTAERRKTERKGKCFTSPAAALEHREKKKFCVRKKN